jgi:hypothetical protein
MREENAVVYGGAGAAAAAAMANAIKASGAIVRVDADAFLTILGQMEAPLIVTATGGFFFGTHYRYLTSYKGLAFFTRSPQPLELPADAEIVYANRISIPD